MKCITFSITFSIILFFNGLISGYYSHEIILKHRKSQCEINGGYYDGKCFNFSFHRKTKKANDK